jgi:hypothetical protein
MQYKHTHINKNWALTPLCLDKKKVVSNQCQYVILKKNVTIYNSKKMWDIKRKCQYVILKKCGTEKKMSICNSKKLWD